MKLLLDQNLSPRLVKSISDVFPGSAHVSECALDRSSDEEVWVYARNHGFVLVTKDSDFQELSVIRGTPPMVILLRLGNCTTARIEHVLRSRAPELRDLADGGKITCLLLYGP